VTLRSRSVDIAVTTQTSDCCPVQVIRKFWLCVSFLFFFPNVRAAVHQREYNHKTTNLLTHHFNEKISRFRILTAQQTRPKRHQLLRRGTSKFL
jgi:hypothetical protein